MKSALVILLLGTFPVLPAETNHVFLPMTTLGYNDKQAEAAAIQEQIQVARRLPESRPAELDPEGHWGQVVSGLQLSIRFATNHFTVGRPIQATVILRNTTTNALLLWSPTAVSLGIKVTDEHGNNLRPAARPLTVSGPMRLLLPGHRQLKYEFQLATLYHLTSPGTYTVCATRPIHTEFGKKTGELSSGTATVQIAASKAP